MPRISIEIYTFRKKLSTGIYENNFGRINVEGGVGIFQNFLINSSFDEYSAIFPELYSRHGFVKSSRCKVRNY